MSAQLCKFRTVGDIITGTITGPPAVRQMTKYGSTELDSWPNGTPKMQIEAAIATEAGPRLLRITPAMMTALREALEAAGVAGPGGGLKPGGIITICWASGEGPARAYTASYELPAPDWTPPEQAAGAAAGKSKRKPKPPVAPPPTGQDPPSPGATPATVQHPSSEPMPGVALLHRILDRIAEEVRALGLVGEERLAQTLYLVVTSRLLATLVSAGVKGHSASGKSHTVATVLGFFPPEAYHEFTAMSEKALIYSPREFAHHTLVMYEAEALREDVKDNMTAYIVRSLLTEGVIKYELTVRKNEYEFTTQQVTKEGPTNLIFTTTKTRVHAENETRVLSLGTDDSRAQTARVMRQLANRQDSNQSANMAEWHQLQRWLAGAEHRVSIPYADQLAQLIPPVAVRLRRDFSALLALISAHAVLHQASRERDGDGRVVANLDDYAVVRGLINGVIAQGVGAAAHDTVRETVAAVAALGDTQGVGLKALSAKLALDQSTVSRRVRRAADDGYLRNLEDKRGKRARWIIGDPLPEATGILPDPADLVQQCNTPQRSDQDRCSVAGVAQGDTPTPTEGPQPPATCATCGQPMVIIKPGQTTHPHCGAWAP